MGQGNAGNLTIRGMELITLSGLDADGEPSTLRTSVAPEAVGDAGNLTVETGQLTLSDGAFITATTFGQGNVGALTIRATESVTLSGFRDDGEPSTISSRVRSGATGNAGDLTIETGQLNLSDAGLISSETLGDGNAGTVSVTADRISLRDGALINVSGIGEFSPGSVRINSDRLQLDNQSAITADTESGNQGNIELSTNSLFLRRNSNIRTNATGAATGGNITINSGVLAALENSDISANAEDNFGGRVIINVAGIFGTEFRDAPTAESDITATSALGPQFSGTVEINTDIDVTSGLIQNPVLPDVTGLIAGGCRDYHGSEFIVTGRGGKPASPDEPLIPESVAVVGWVELPDVELETDLTLEKLRLPNNLNDVGAIRLWLPPNETRIVEATGYMINPNGRVILTADRGMVNFSLSSFMPPICPVEN